jgi:hypothetical protein
MRTRIGVGLFLFAVISPVRALALEILSPLPGTVVRSGQLVTIRVGPSGGETIESVLLATSEGRADAPPLAGSPGIFEGQVRIPGAAAGPELVLVAATLAGSGRVVTNHVEIVADPGPLMRLELVQPPALTFVGQVLQLEVRGVFEDGATRDLSSPETGTRYESSDPTILGIDPSGLVQARRAGTASVRVRCRGLVALAAVSVAVPDPPGNTIPVAEAGPHRIVSPLSVVVLSGTASNDSDGDPLTYLWEQQAGPWVSLRSAASAIASFLSPSVATETVIDFSLTVKDSRGATSFPRTVQITVRP